MRAAYFLRRGVSALVLVLTFPAAAWPQAPPQVPARVALDDAIRMALDRNQAIRAQRLAIEASRADQITAGLKPNLGVSFGADGFPPFAPKQINWHFLVNSVSYSSSVSYLFERGGKRDKRTIVARGHHRAWPRKASSTPSGSCASRRRRRSSTSSSPSRRSIWRARTSRTSPNVVDVNRAARARPATWPRPTSTRSRCRSCSSNRTSRPRKSPWSRPRRRCGRTLGFEAVAGGLRHRRRPGLHEPSRSTLDDLKRQALAEPARPAGRAKRREARRRTRSGARAQQQGARHHAAAWTTTAAGPAERLRLRLRRSICRSTIATRATSRTARSHVRQATESEAAPAVHGVLTDVVNAYADFQTNKKVVALYQSGYLDQAQAVARDHRPTSTSTAAARCSICSTPNAPIATRSWRTARRWRPT